MDERIWLWCAVIAYSISSFRPRRNNFFQRANFIFFAVAFLCHTVFLALRGKELRHCPISNEFEVTAYIAWSIALVYLVVGRLYRLTLIGWVTCPLLSLGLGWALLVASDQKAQVYLPGYALELHAGFCILAYGALGIAAICGGVFLIQDRLLRKKLHMGWLAHLPSLSDVTRVNRYLLLCGWILLSAGVASSFFVDSAARGIRVAWFVLIWLSYAIVLVAALRSRLSGWKTAVASIALYLLMVGTFWGLGHVVPALR